MRNNDAPERQLMPEPRTVASAGKVTTVTGCKGRSTAHSNAATAATDATAIHGHRRGATVRPPPSRPPAADAASDNTTAVTIASADPPSSSAGAGARSGGTVSLPSRCRTTSAGRSPTDATDTRVPPTASMSPVASLRNPSAGSLRPLSLSGAAGAARMPNSPSSIPNTPTVAPAASGMRSASCGDPPTLQGNATSRVPPGSATRSDGALIVGPS